ncbi:heme peroxidase, partial [Ochromonadaceae sp. CCMP2298]
MKVRASCIVAVAAAFASLHQSAAGCPGGALRLKRNPKPITTGSELSTIPPRHAPTLLADLSDSFCARTNFASAPSTKAGACAANHEITSLFSSLPTTVAYRSDLYGQALRLAFHDAGEGDVRTADAFGPDGCLHDPADNAGLLEPSSLVSSVLEPAWQRVCDGITRADFWALFGKRAAEEASGQGLHVPYQIGRKDSTSCGGAAGTLTEGRLPSAQGGLGEIARVFADQLNLTIAEAVTLIGAHSVGHTHLNNSGYAFTDPDTLYPVLLNAWDDTPAVLDNDYFIKLTDMGWKAERTVSLNGSQWRHLDDPWIFLNVDMALGYPIDLALPNVTRRQVCGPRTLDNTSYGCRDPSAITPPSIWDQSLSYALNNSLFLSEFAPAFAKMTTVGYGLPADVEGATASGKLGTLTAVKLDTCPPTVQPTFQPTFEPTIEPTAEPTAAPTAAPTSEPTLQPTAEPSFEPTLEPTTAPSAALTAAPTSESTLQPTAEPSFEPTLEPTAEPTAAPTAAPTFEPTLQLTAEPSFEPTLEPTAEPTATPTAKPTFKPTMQPTAEPSFEPTLELTAEPTAEPTAAPTFEPTLRPTVSTPVQINVVQVIAGVGATAFMGDPGSESAFTEAVALTLGYVAPSDVLVQGAVPVLRQLLRYLIATHPIELSAGEVSITRRYLQESVTGAEQNVTAVSYTILTTAEDVGFVDANAAFADVSAKLEGAVESGEFERNLRDRAIILSVPLLLDVVCGTVTADLGEVSGILDDDASGTSGIAGSGMSVHDLTLLICTFATAALCIVCLFTYYMLNLVQKPPCRRVLIPEITIRGGARKG